MNRARTDESGRRWMDAWQSGTEYTLKSSVPTMCSSTCLRSRAPRISDPADRRRTPQTTLLEGSPWPGDALSGRETNRLTLEMLLRTKMAHKKENAPTFNVDGYRITVCGKGWFLSSCCTASMRPGVDIGGRWDGVVLPLIREFRWVLEPMELPSRWSANLTAEFDWFLGIHLPMPGILY